MFHKLGYSKFTPRLIWVVEARHGIYRRASDSPVRGSDVRILDEIRFVDDSRFESAGGAASERRRLSRRNRFRLLHGA
jgi:hypothetical protein